MGDRKKIDRGFRLFCSLALLMAVVCLVKAHADQPPGADTVSGMQPILPARDYFPDGNFMGKRAEAFSATYNFNAYPRLVNGPARNRVNIGIAGDGYAVGDTAKFPAHADSNIAYRRGLSSIKNNKMVMRPYPRYDKFFNWYIVNLVSPQSGISVAPAWGQPKTTTINNALGGTRDNDRLGWVDDNRALAMFSQAQTKLGAKIHWMQVILNINGYYNSGGTISVFAYPNWGDIACHEAGHTFHKFADEYFSCDGSSSSREPREINVTATVGSPKWSHWVGYKDIDPRVGANPGIGCNNGGDTIGYYVGANYVQRGQYRPSNNSKMNMTGQSNPTSFNAVCREKIIHDIYAIVNPLDTFADTAGRLTDPDSIWVRVIDPAVLKVDWYVDGELKKAGGGEVLKRSEIASVPGNYTVKAHVYDEAIRHAFSSNKTPDSLDLVRDDTTDMVQDVQWKVMLGSVASAAGIVYSRIFSARVVNTALIYNLQAPSEVSITLFRANGSLVQRTEQHGIVGENVYNFTVDNRGNRPVPAGFYIVNIAAGTACVNIPAIFNGR